MLALQCINVDIIFMKFNSAALFPTGTIETTPGRRLFDTFKIDPEIKRAIFKVSII